MSKSGFEWNILFFLRQSHEKNRRALIEIMEITEITEITELIRNHGNRGTHMDRL